MRTSEQGVALIKQFEGFSPQLYLCPAGKMTIGYGHVVQAGECFSDVIDEARAHDLLIADLEPVECAIEKLVSVPLNQGQFDALASFTYNLGIGALRSSTLLKLLNKLDYSAAADQWLRWCYAAGKRLKGLEKRREAEQRLFCGVDLRFN